MERCQPNSVKPKTRKGKLISGVIWQGALKKNGVKPALGVYSTGRVITDKGKLKSSEKKLSQCTASIIESIWTALGSNPDARSQKPASYCLNNVTA